MNNAFRSFAYAALCVTFLSLSWTSPRADPALYGFLAGTYDAIGQRPESETTYAGTVTIEADEGKLRITRAIGGTTAAGTGTLEKRLDGKVDVLIVRFSENGKDYEASYLIDSDLDNYARLTGYVYLAGGDTKRAGLEALFPEHGRAR